MRKALFVLALAVPAGACSSEPSEMDIVLIETGAVTSGPLTLAPEFAFDLALRVGDEPGSIEPPTDLEIVPDDADTVRVEELGRIAFDYDGRPSSSGSGGEGTRVRLTPLASGQNTIRFFADNSVEDPSLLYRTVTVDQVTFDSRVQGDPDSASTEDTRVAFVGSRVLIDAHYEGEGWPVVGRETLELESGSADGSGFVDVGSEPVTQTLDLGDAPHTAVVRSPATGATLTIEVVDAAAIRSVDLLVGGAPFDAETSWAARQGEMLRVELVAHDRDGVRIAGSSPTAVERAIHGDSVRESSFDGSGGWFEAVGRGESTIVLTWGEVMAALTVAVQ